MKPTFFPGWFVFKHAGWGTDIIYLLPSFETDFTVAYENTICASFTKARYCCRCLLVLGFGFYGKGTAFTLFPVQQLYLTTTKKSSPALGSSKQESQCTEQCFPEQIQSKANRFAGTCEHWQKDLITEYLWNCTTSTYRCENYFCPQLKAQDKL